MNTAKTAGASMTVNFAKASVWEALKQALPIVMGYVPVGFAYGVLAQKVGISMLNTVLMSVVVYAGSAQLIGVGLIGAAIAPVSVVATTFIINLRHLLMSAALSPYMRSWSKARIAAFSFELTDETFALHSQRFAAARPETPASKREALLINVLVQASWVVGSWLGFSAGTLIPDVKPMALDYALPAMFITLLVGQVKNRLHVLIAILSGALAVGLLLLGVDQWNVIIATIVTAALGAALTGRSEREPEAETGAESEEAQ